MFLLDFHNAFLIVTTVMNVFLAAVIFTRRSEKTENQIYVLNIACIIWWTIAIIFYRSSLNSDDLILLATNLYLAPTFIASSFLYFSLFFPEQKVKRPALKAAAIFIPNLIVTILVLTPGTVIEAVIPTANTEHMIYFGPWYWLYAVYISFNFSLGLAILAHRFSVTKKRIHRRQISYLLVGYLAASTLAMLTNLILPWFGEFRLNWLGQGLTVLMVVPVAYAIFKHRLFSTRLIATELFVLILSILLLVRAVIPQNFTERILNFGLFTGALFIGILLIKSVNKEIKTREEISKLATELAGANLHLERLDKMKSEFVSMASHQLRSPLTSIRGYISMILEGSYGEVEPKVREILEHVSDSSRQMALSVEDYLNVSRIEAGRMKYEMADCDLRKLVEDTVAEMLPVSLKRDMIITFKPEFKGPAIVKLDIGKTKQIIQNLVDNAMKYTPEKGRVTVTLRKDETNEKVFVDITDTGIGIAQEALGEIFKKFERAKNANSINVTGTGLGLYIAKQMAEAMAGSVTVSSEGEGKGSTFTITFPIGGTKKKEKTTEKVKSKNSDQEVT